jgi:hypothetical protein
VLRNMLRWYRLFTTFVDLINKELTGLASLIQTSNTVQEWIYVCMHGVLSCFVCLPALRA